MSATISYTSFYEQFWLTHQSDWSPDQIPFGSGDECTESDHQFQNN